MKNKKLWHTKEKHQQQQKKQPTEYKKVFANDISDKGLVSGIYKELIKLSTPKKQILQLKNGQKT